MIEEQCREWNTDNGISKPPPTIDKQLLENFTELEIQAAAHSGYKMNLQQQQRLLCRQDILESMPKVFSSLHQARTTLHLITIRQIHRTLALDTTDGHLACPLSVHILAAGRSLSEAAREEQWRRFREYKAWDSASKPLFMQAMNLKDDRLIKHATVTRLTYLTSYLSIYAPTLEFREYYYNQTHLLAEIIALINKLHVNTSQATQRDRGFSLNMNLIIPLKFVACRYRHRALRQKAIKLLLACPRREGPMGWSGHCEDGSMDG